MNKPCTKTGNVRIGFFRNTTVRGRKSYNPMAAGLLRRSCCVWFWHMILTNPCQNGKKFFSLLPVIGKTAVLL